MSEAVGRAPLVVGIGGSTSATSVTASLLRSVLGTCAQLGAVTEEFAAPYLATLPIYAATEPPLAIPEAEPLLDAVRRADAVVIATPGYHGGMSGLVKNALDHLEALRGDARPYLDGRAVGAVVSAAGWQACGTTLTSVRSTIHALRGWPTPFGVTVNTAEQRVGLDGAFDERVSGGLQILAEQLLGFARR
ncbi:MAG TPA: NAD(P)H-dependent oxidoreductase [Jatrophihabitantaceae bacterium]|nr:NAD(P)H-dependent oxidoreductase [Jatrophihabitantaceae bacterium]